MRGRGEGGVGVSGCGHGEPDDDDGDVRRAVVLLRHMREDVRLTRDAPGPGTQVILDEAEMLNRMPHLTSAVGFIALSFITTLVETCGQECAHGDDEPCPVDDASLDQIFDEMLSHAMVHEGGG